MDGAEHRRPHRGTRPCESRSRAAERSPEREGETGLCRNGWRGGPGDACFPVPPPCNHCVHGCLRALLFMSFMRLLVTMMTSSLPGAISLMRRYTCTHARTRTRAMSTPAQQQRRTGTRALAGGLARAALSLCTLAAARPAPPRRGGAVAGAPTMRRRWLSLDWKSFVAAKKTSLASFCGARSEVVAGQAACGLPGEMAGAGAGHRCTAALLPGAPPPPQPPSPPW